MKTIAVIGTGIMGNGIATNFLKAGYPVYVWNRHTEKLADLMQKGAQAADSPKAATEQADMVFEITADDNSSRSVWLGEDGIIKGAKKDNVLISCATLSAEWVDELGTTCEQQGLTFFDMPMTGGRQAAESGKLILLAGGDEAKLKDLQPDLKAISEKIIHFGKAGSGTRYKLLLNMLQAIHIEALGEVLKIAQKAGMDIKKVGDALAERPGGTTTNLTWRDYHQKSPEPINFSVQWITKDLNYAKKLAETLNTPLLDEALRKYEEAMKQGKGNDDWTAITHSP